ncbi:tubulin epsilon and delta complex protein 2 isoform X2 [Anolis sagrei]|uniref:tubulin epsilon and delta complex protein 2 isoform X2 n=1 Tax=Anolis sagrei TaxID=38937 RepID=UPI00351FD17D
MAAKNGVATVSRSGLQAVLHMRRPTLREEAVCGTGAGAFARPLARFLWRGTAFGFRGGSVGGEARKPGCCPPTALAGWFPCSPRPWMAALSKRRSCSRRSSSARIFFKTACAENEPSAKELEELELLNKALEKALRVRTKFQPAPGEGAKSAGEKAASGTPMSLQVGNASKESTSRIGRAVPVIRKPASPKRPMTYMPKAPYRTDPVVKRRPLGKTSARPSTRASKMLGRKRPATGTASLVATVPVTVTQPGREQSCVAKEPGKQAPCAFEASVGQRDAAAGANPLSPKTESDLSSAQAQVISTLREKGSLLELPHPYKKAFSKYMRLLGKCHNCQTSPEAVAARNRFVEKMQTTFCSPSPAFSPVEVRRELLHLKGLCSLMRHCMEAETSASLGENPTWEREHESLLTLEGLQVIVQEQLDKVQQLREAMESHAELLLAESVNGKGCSSQGNACLGTERCWDAETVRPPPLLFYSSSKELMDMEALKLKVAKLQQQLEIQKAMEAELLPLLEPGCLQEGSQALLFRAIYTLLCEGSESFPVLVNDSVE